jgi:DNA primase
MIKKTTVDRVLDTVRIEEVVEDFVRLRKRGANMLGLCPFHNEKTPSFNVNVSGNFYKCFGCGKGGNSVNFIMEHEKLSFPEAIRYLANKYNIPIEEDQLNEADKEEILHRENLLSLTQYAAIYYQQQLWDTDEGRNIGVSYFKERSYRDQIIRDFMLGYAPRDKTAFTMQATKDGFTLDMLQECGLTSGSGNDFFYNRVMFTIQDMSGRPIAFAGRIMGTNEKAPKYINSPESEIYKKSYVLYGFFQARKSMKKEDHCIIVEGYTDVLSLHQAGIENVVASSGTALTEGQVRLIKRFTDNIIMLYDADTAGINAASKAIDLILELDMHPLSVLLPPGEDPDSFVRKTGASGFNDYLDTNVMDFLSFKWHLLPDTEKNDPVKKTQIIKDIIESIAKIPDPIKRSLYVKECGIKFEIDESAISAELNNLVRKNVYRQRKQSERTTEMEISTPNDKKITPTQKNFTDPDIYQEKDILRILLLYGEKIVYEEDKISVADFILANLEDAIDAIKDPSCKKLFNIAREFMELEGKLSIDQFLNHPDNDVQHLTTELIATPWEYSHNWEDRWGISLQTQRPPEDNFLNDTKQAILRYKLKQIKQQLKSIQKEIDNAIQQGNEDEALKLMGAFRKLLDDRNQVAGELNMVVL